MTTDDLPRVTRERFPAATVIFHAYAEHPTVEAVITDRLAPLDDELRPTWFGYDIDPARALGAALASADGHPNRKRRPTCTSSPP
jgi:hypothetical protein